MTFVNVYFGLIFRFLCANMVIKGRTPLSIVPEVWLLLPVYGHFFPSCPVCNAEKLGA